MADGINGLTGYGIGANYYNTNKGNTKPEDDKKTADNMPKPEYKEVDPNEVMKFLSANNYFVNINNESHVNETNYVTDPNTEARVAASMKDFEYIYGLIVNEFGEAHADTIMDLVMDKLLGINY